LTSAALLAGAYAAPATARLPRGHLLFPTVRRVEPNIDAVALTFDDGPDSGLGGFLDLLEDAGARATFFIVGDQVERFPDGPREIVARGHEVALHCHRHRNHLRLTPGQTVDDMRRAKAAIEDASGRPVRLFRPPYGIFNAASWYEAGWQGWDRMLWSRWGRDWEERATSGSVAEEIGVPRQATYSCCTTPAGTPPLARLVPRAARCR
jgi:peptidoglycan/xylan/chitin deacetylase (PgdA/CDA1 family)